MPRLILFTFFFMLFVITGNVNADSQVSPGQQDKQTSVQAAVIQENTKTEAVEKKTYNFLNSERTKQEPVGTSMDALNVSLGLIFILLLIFSLAWFMRKMGYTHLSGQGQLKLLATMNLGQKEKIALIQVGQQQLLVGITSQQINTLHVLDESLEATEFQTNTVGSSDQKNGFAQKLSEKLNTIKVKH